jgi:hypothetical protein
VTRCSKARSHDNLGVSAASINTFIPGPVASPQRSATHPGEVKSSMRTPESLAPYYLYLMGRDGRAVKGQTINAA